jgi:hypothetical protein
MTTTTKTYWYHHVLGFPPSPISHKDAADKVIKGEVVTLGPILIEGVEYS